MRVLPLLLAVLTSACAPRPDSMLETVEEYLFATGRLHDQARIRLHSLIHDRAERPPFEVVDLTGAEGLIIGALVHDDPVVPQRATDLLCHLALARHSILLEKAPPADHERSGFISRLMPFLAVAVTRAAPAHRVEMMRCMRSLPLGLVDEPHHHLMQAAQVMRAGVHVTPQVTYRHARLTWSWRRAIERARGGQAGSWAEETIRLLRLQDRRLGPPLDRAGDEVLRACAAALRQSHCSGPPPPTPPAEQPLTWPTACTPDIPLSMACAPLLAQLDCTPHTCAQRLIGDLATSDIPLQVRRLLVMWAIASRLAPGLPPVAPSDFHACSDGYMGEPFCVSSALALVAAGTFTSAEVAQLVDANQLAWAFVDRPAWLEWR